MAISDSEHNVSDRQTPTMEAAMLLDEKRAGGDNYTSTWIISSMPANWSEWSLTLLRRSGTNIERVDVNCRDDLTELIPARRGERSP